MKQILTGLIVGILAGGAVVYVLTRPSGQEPAIVPATPGDSTLSRAGALSVDEKLAIYRLAATAEPSALIRLIDETRGRTDSTERTFTLVALTERLGELDPFAAIAIAIETNSGLDDALVTDLFGRAAAIDPGRSLEALRTLAGSGQIRLVSATALALLQEFESNGGLIGQWLDTVADLQPAAGSPPDFAFTIANLRFSVSTLQAAGLAALAELDPDAALTRLLALDDEAALNAAVGRMAAALTADDPKGVLSKLDELADVNVRIQSRGKVLEAWARKEPQAALSYVASRRDWDDEEMRGQVIASRTVVGAMLSAGADPREVFELSRQLPGDLVWQAQESVIRSVYLHDPLTAAELLEQLPAQYQNSLMNGVAYYYAQIDPGGALQWASRQTIASGEASVLRSVAKNDPSLALDLAIDGPVRSRADALAAVVRTAIDLDAGSAPALAPKLRERLSSSALFGNVIVELTEQYVSKAHEEGLNWLVEQGRDVPDRAYETAVRALWRNPEITAPYVDRLPASARTDWIATVAGGYAQDDTDRALEWIEQFRGSRQEYARAFGEIVRVTAHLDAPRAAQLFRRFPENADPAEAQLAVDKFISVWSEKNPRAAAEFANGLSNETLRRPALLQATREWSRTDPDATGEWLRSLPASAARDAALVQHAATIR